ncbi:serine/threonine protein kinase Chk2, putative [Entamoeba invadens IP1]|uniref:non-specific serine/threonine protein kinase n=1 Tax=Entamoeba invadens IP1 TaxID=370355 RepID=A0A0A1U9Y4_ENTIV|nr:serine/threonine protein kinase Chk2, putative [Entamoeba invadens IP1]ELP91847.1 serine/threonine protein kinase Chk2, putative [Entamoeba invadens IP1]|eukprot:XP_004258618.1 serine/threonine protein kinase Chk2, putative [Entamoeba invadens IP1]
MKAWGQLVSMSPGYPNVPIVQEDQVFGKVNPQMGLGDCVHISHRHFSIRARLAGEPYYVLTDTSTNGTCVNGELIGRGRSTQIKNYDDITMLPGKTIDCVSYMFESFVDIEEEKKQGGPQNAYEVGKFCGVGNFAMVRQVRNIQENQLYAMKVIDLKKAQLVSSRPNAVFDECTILNQLKHENIVALKTTYQTEKYLYMILELASGGELFQQIIAETSFSEEKCRIIMKQMFSALGYLHSHNIVHRDLKPENILCVTKGGDQIKITDFGLSRIITQTSLAKTMCGTPLYVAPEILSGQPYNGSKVDVWSAGVILFVMVCGYPPFSDGDDGGNRQLFDCICHQRYEFDPAYWGNKSPEVKDLIRHMLVVDIEKRYSIDQCVSHPFITGMEITKLANERDAIKTDSPISSTEPKLQINSQKGTSFGNPQLSEVTMKAQE